MNEELRFTGETRALYVALMAVIAVHPLPKKAARTAQDAIEAEIVQVAGVNYPDLPTTTILAGLRRGCF